MDNLTHTLTGIALGQAGLKRKSRFAMLGLIIASNIPDVDIIAHTRGSLAYLEHHRGITHSLIGFTVLAAVLAFILYEIGRRSAARKNTPPLRLKWLFLVCWIGAAVHVLMDFTNSYGIRPLLPFSGRWFALNLVPVIDLWLLFALILGLCVPVVLGLVTEEVGARKGNAKAVRNGAIFSLCAIGALWGLRGLSHHRALNMLGAHTYGEENPVTLGAFPTALDPFGWHGVVETDSAFYLLDVSALSGDVMPEEATVLRKPPPSRALDVAQKTQVAKAFLQFARLPYAIVYADEDGFRVYLRDLRFARPGIPYWNFVAEVVLDQSLRIKGQTFEFVMKKPVY
ncbi:MAG TPA: metal-dependent hydrolase [Terriglobia bacterium]|nr:metal-dependent hydrolase [Terriglobia bacterium]